ncbi:MAG: hypothetical protein HFJ85_04025 [Oscillospiraceae bacterium]|nr:hypothetical protein [Oscillospiraceae bacterium]
MLYRIRSGVLQLCGKEERYNRQDCYIAVSRRDEEADLMAGSAARAVLTEILDDHSIRFESREGIALLCFACLGFTGRRLLLKQIHIVFGRGWMQLICEDNEAALTLIDSLMGEQNGRWTSGRFLYRLFELLLSDGSTAYLKHLEKRAAKAEKGIRKGRRCRASAREIFYLRRRLIELRQIFEETLAILRGLSECGLLDEPSVKYVESYTGKTERLFHRIRFLEEYTAELRESCRMQEKVTRNAVLKLFTVTISALLPLVLVIAWCDVEIELPSYFKGLEAPAAAAAGVLIILIELLYFKGNRRL